MAGFVIGTPFWVFRFYSNKRTSKVRFYIGLVATLFIIWEMEVPQRILFHSLTKDKTMYDIEIVDELFDGNTDDVNYKFSDEFKKCLKEVKLGKTLTEGLVDLMQRIPSKSVCNVILNIIEANEFGNSIEGALINQVNYLTDKRILDIKSNINKMPMKISIISVLLFLPLMLILIIGPIIINYFFK